MARKKPRATGAGLRDKPKRLDLSDLGGLNGLNEHGSDLEQIARDAVVGNLKDGRSGVLVHRNDALGILHARLVLNGAGDAQCHIDLRMYRLASLTNLVVRRQPAGVNDRTRAADNAAQDLRQLL